MLLELHVSMVANLRDLRDLFLGYGDKEHRKQVMLFSLDIGPYFGTTKGYNCITNFGALIAMGGFKDNWYNFVKLSSMCQ
jgi:hypothetical protein